MERLNIRGNADITKKYGILGIPWDEDASHGRPGSRFAPEKIRQNGKWIFDRIEEGKVLDLEDFRLIDLNHAEVCDFGDIEICSYDHFETKKRIFDKVKSLHEENYVPVILGGDCSVTYPQIQALCEVYGNEIGIVHFDGHLDLLDSTPIQGEFSHSSSIRRAVDRLGVNPKNIVQIGCRCYNYPSYYEYILGQGITEISPRELYLSGIEAVASKTLDIAWKGAKAVLVTIDIDVLEGIYAPGSGANETGGLTTFELQEIMKYLAPHTTSFNVTEVNPAYDVNDFSSIAAAKLFFDFIIHHYEPTKRALDAKKN
ncbi:agmatinase family protein [Synergistaceae bacterium OttesenSCG-928-I11]|nr:agmatinase family protein [Synergistaceae bacterium OttesenSCG-928-I11]